MCHGNNSAVPPKRGLKSRPINAGHKLSLEVRGGRRVRGMLTSNEATKERATPCTLKTLQRNDEHKWPGESIEKVKSSRTAA